MLEPFESVRWGIVGCGDVTERKSGPGFQNVEGSSLFGVMRRDAAKAEDYARRHGIPFWTSNADELINHPDVDAVYIATPPGSHHEYALKVAAAGKPCLVEKPMARHAVEAREMLAAFERKGLPLFVAFYRRSLPRFVELKRVVDSGELGTITSIQVHYSEPVHERVQPDDLPWRVVVREAGAGVFLDLASHTLDLLDHIFGALHSPLSRALNMASPYAAEDVVHTQLLTSGGIPVSATWNFAAHQQVDRLEIQGTKACITCSIFGNDPLRIWKGGRETEIIKPNPVSVHEPLIRTIVDELRGKGKCPSTGSSALRTTELMDTILHDYYGGRGDQFWDREENWLGRRRAD